MEVPFATAKPGNEEPASVEAPPVPEEEPKPKRTRKRTEAEESVEPAQAEPDPDPLTDIPHGDVGEAIYAEVESMTKNGTTSRTAAFDEIATRTGRKAGTVAANYYRVAKQKGTVAPRARKTTRQSPAAQSLAGQIAAMEDELAELREFKRNIMAIMRSA